MAGRRPDTEQARAPAGTSVALIGTYPPTRCGIATFTASLARAIAVAEPGCRFGVVDSVAAHRSMPQVREVVAQLVAGSPSSLATAVAALEGFDAVVLQHEFGIYGGDEGSEVLDLLYGLELPVIVTLHTVSRRPAARQQAIIEQIGAARVVVQSRSARTWLLEQYDVDPAKVRTIPHGARANLTRRPTRYDSRTPLVITWGLLGPDKGIEWGIEALARLSDLTPAPRYAVVGQTHPRILQAEGETYRASLVELVATLGVEDRVEFDNAYHDTHSLLRRVREADVVLLPYRSREQVVSGVLVEAIASGKPVVATRFPHAEELLSEGSGLLVRHEDAEATSAAVRRLLSDSALASRAATVARRQARALFWENVGARYLDLVHEVVPGRLRLRPSPAFPPPIFEHLLALADDVGVFEHARLTVPRLEHGYCTDDVARALVAVMREPVRTPELERLAETCLGFLEGASRSDGRFRKPPVDRRAVAGRGRLRRRDRARALGGGRRLRRSELPRPARASADPLRGRCGFPHAVTARQRFCGPGRSRGAGRRSTRAGGGRVPAVAPSSSTYGASP